MLYISSVQVASSTSIAEEVIGNLATVKSFAMEEEEVVRYEASLDRAAAAYSQLGLGIGLFTALSSLATNGKRWRQWFSLQDYCSNTQNSIQ